MANRYWDGSSNGWNFEMGWGVDFAGNTESYGLPQESDSVFFTIGDPPNAPPLNGIILADFYVSPGINTGIMPNLGLNGTVQVNGTMTIPGTRDGDTVIADMLGVFLAHGSNLVLHDPLPPAPPVANGGGPLGGPEINI